MRTMARSHGDLLSRQFQWTLCGAVAAGWAALLVVILAHPIFVTNDSLSNYAHVWHVSESISNGGFVPYHFPQLASGDALAYPYAFIPWTTAALLRPLLGDWATTLWLVVGLLLVVGATLWALPELRRPLSLALVLANPVLVEAVILGQLPFLWAGAFLFGALGAWRRKNWVLATAMATACNTTHVAVVAPLLAVVVAAWFFREPDKRRLVVCYGVSVVLSLPAVAMVVLSPALQQSGTGVVITNFFGTVGWRALVVAAPFGALWLAKRSPSAGVLTVLVVLALNAVLVPVRGNDFAWGALTRSTDDEMVPFLESSQFAPGRIYRVLRASDGKVSMYQTIQHGGVLDSEFFPESIRRQNWENRSDYVAFLASRRVDFVVIFRSYDYRYKTNEHELLERMVASDGDDHPAATVVTRYPDFDVYQMTRKP